MLRFGRFSSALLACCLAACSSGSGGGGSTPPQPTNHAPVANAGADQNILFGASVTLDGQASSDADGDALTYSWAVSAPDGSPVTLNTATPARPSFTASQVGTYVATLTVSDGKTSSASDTANIVVPNPWSSPSPLPTTRTDFHAVTVGTKIYLMGGMAAGAPAAKVDVFDTVNATWSVAAPDPKPREASAAIAVGTKIYVIGGGPAQISPPNPFVQPQVRTVEIFDTATGMWSDGPDMPTGRTGVVAGAIGNTLYAVNGFQTCNCIGHDYPIWHPLVNEAFDTVAGSWSSVPLPPLMFDGGGTATVGQSMFVMGIRTQSSIQSSAANPAILRFSVTTGSWTKLPDMPRWTPNIATVGSSIYAIRDGVDRYDPATGSWLAARAPALANLFANGDVTGPAAAAGAKIYIFTATGLVVYDPSKDAF